MNGNGRAGVRRDVDKTPCNSEVEVTVLGLGNVLMRDDALGPYVVRTIESAYDTCPRVRLLDAGTPGFDLAPQLMGTEVLIIVDTIKADGAPGELRMLTKDQLLKHAPVARISPHEPGLKETLMLLDLEGGGPKDVLLIGVIPLEVRTGTGLSAPVQAAVAHVIREVIRELMRLGHVPEEREAATPRDIWWERRLNSV